MSFFIRQRAPFFWLAVALGSCSYTLRRGEMTLGGTRSDAGPQKIFLPVVDNLTSRTGFEAEVTSALRETVAQVNGLQVVENADDAKLFLLTKVTTYNRHVGPSPAVGKEDTQANGGLVNGALTAGYVNVEVGLLVKLVERVGPGTNRMIWTREFKANSNYYASRRFVLTSSGSVGGDLTELGSSSAPHINASREQVQVHTLAADLARQVVDQVVQDF